MLLLVAAAPAASARVCRAPAWHIPTPPASASVDARAGTPFRLRVSAYTAGHCSGVALAGLGLPSGARLRARPGRLARGELVWTPTATDIGRVPVTISARQLGRPHLAVTRTIVVVVRGPDDASPRTYTPAQEGTTSWSYVLERALTRTRPAAQAATNGSLDTLTSDGAWNLVPLLSAYRDRKGLLWFEVPLATLPNGTTGWVPARALAPPRTVVTRLTIDRSAATATLYRRDVVVWSARVAVGAPGSPTPAGTFYVREQLTGFDDPAYGPIAFGTNARSAVETDWPGGGMVGIHGTNEPQSIPGAISHGCVRLRNSDIAALAHLMPLGTPVVIR